MNLRAAYWTGDSCLVNLNKSPLASTKRKQNQEHLTVLGHSLRHKQLWAVAKGGIHITSLQIPCLGFADNIKRHCPQFNNNTTHIMYKTFKRSCTNWRQFGSARKITYDTDLTYDEARRQCERFNANLTSAQKCKGTKLEFESQ